MKRARIAGRAVRGQPKPPAEGCLPDAGLADRCRRRRPGSLATAKPLRHKRRREPGGMAHDGRGARVPEPLAGREDRIDPEHESLLADSIGLALLVVLEPLAPAERVAFVLHDMFDLPFDEIAPIVGRSPTAARQLASRARRRVQGAAMPNP